MLAAVTWFARLVACVLIGVLTFVTDSPSSGEVAFAIAVLLIGSAIMLGWFITDLIDTEQHRQILARAMVGMAALTSVASIAPHCGAFIGFAILAVLAAGTDTSRLAGWVTAAVAVLGIAVGALIFSIGNDRLWNYPLVLALALLIGRNRRAFLIQAGQSDAMLAQLETLRAEQRQVAVLDERNRIAREIHDVLAHSLGALGIQLQATRAVLDNADVPRARRLLEQAQRMATDGLVDTRRAVQALRGDPARLDQQLVSLVDTHRARHQAAVELHIDGDPVALPPESGVALIRTAQEALVNTAKHAPGEPVRICLTYSENQVSLRVANRLPGSPADDGSRTARPSTFTGVNGGYGLIGMRERLLLLNGTLITGADSDHRWIVLAELPR
jgi:signal transduction histidine kinase